MSLVVTLVGLLVIAAGIWIAIAPGRLIGWMAGLESNLRFRLAIAIRAILGIAFLVAAPDCDLPRVTQVVGVVMLVAAAGLLVIGRRRLDAVVEMFAALDSGYLRAWSIFALAFGVLLVYAG